MQRIKSFPIKKLSNVQETILATICCARLTHYVALAKIVKLNQILKQRLEPSIIHTLDVTKYQASFLVKLLFSLSAKFRGLTTRTILLLNFQLKIRGGVLIQHFGGRRQHSSKKPI